MFTFDEEDSLNINTVHSIPVTSIVTQGFILGLLLLITFINDIGTDLDMHCLPFADDMELYWRIESIRI